LPELRTLALENLLDRTKGKVIIWSRFSPCIERLTKHFGKEAVKYRGGMTRDERLYSKDMFIRNPKVRFIFAQPKSAGTGTDGFQDSCRHAVYWSNSYDSSQRRQTERRTWRLGQSHACVYADLIAPGTYDARIRDVIMNGQRMSDNFHKELAAWKRNGH
jgi:SNF2 family DNA or RNA helicase